MRTIDIINLCRKSLSRQKGRTSLTILGVVIGCCAIILMLSLGIASSEQTKIMLQNMGDLTLIRVYGYNNGKDNKKLDNKTLDEIETIPNVEIATPKYGDINAGLNIKAGNNDRYVYEYPQIIGMKPEAMEKLGYSLVKGDWLSNTPAPAKSPIPIVVGEKFFYGFKDTKRPDGQNRRNYTDTNDMYMNDRFQDEKKQTEDEKPFFDDLNTKLTLELTSNDTSGNSEEPKVYRRELRIVGVMKQDMSKGYETSEGVIMNISNYVDLIKMIGDKNVVNKDIKYNDVVVKVNNIDNVKSVEKDIKAMGFETSSMESVRESINKSTRQQQMTLAGLGGISLFVAAIGIMNTMIMSITERTKEIGIMKALGCYVNDVMKIFLTEAGFIGLIGGVIGIIISGIISFCMNVAASIGLISNSMDSYDIVDDGMSLFEKIKNINIDPTAIYNSLITPGNRMSVIPWWLIIFGLIFSTLIGILSGLYPAYKAVKIPALEAIKHE